MVWWAISTIVTLLAIYFPCLYNFILFLTRMDADTRVRSGLSSTICPGTCYWQDPGLLFGVFMSNIDLFGINREFAPARYHERFWRDRTNERKLSCRILWCLEYASSCHVHLWHHGNGHLRDVSPSFFNSIASQSNNILIKSRNGPVSLIVVSILYGFFSSACQYFKTVKKNFSWHLKNNSMPG